MNTRIALWIFIGLLFIATLFLTFKAGSVEVTSVAQTAAVAVKSASSGMVGGC